MSEHDTWYSGDESHHMRQPLTEIRVPLEAVQSILRALDERPSAGRVVEYGDNGERWVRALVLPDEATLSITLPSQHVGVVEGGEL